MVGPGGHDRFRIADAIATGFAATAAACALALLAVRLLSRDSNAVAP